MTAATDEDYLRLALRLAGRGYGQTSPNPMVGAVLVKKGAVIGRGWHHRAGEPHAEIEALRDAHRRGNKPAGATLYVTLEPCCTHGRTPPCTSAIIDAGLRRVVVGAIDPNPAHQGQGLRLLQAAGLTITHGVLAEAATRLNEAFNHWIERRTPFVILKAAMTLDGKIATAAGESKWITGEKARAAGMKLRAGADAIVVGVNTILQDDPSLTVRTTGKDSRPAPKHKLRRFILDSLARTPLTSRVASDEHAELTTVVVTENAPVRRVKALAKRVSVWTIPARHGRVDLPRLMDAMGRDQITSVLVEGGGEVNAAFLRDKLARRVAFFYAPKIIGGRDAKKAVAGEGVPRLAEAARLRQVEWRRLGPDLLLSALIDYDYEKTQCVAV